MMTPTAMDTTLHRPFEPIRPLRNPHLQTILASLRFRAWGKNPLRKRSEPVLVDAGGGVRLLGYRTVQPVGGSTNEPCHGIETNNKREPAVSVSVYG